MNIDFSKLKKEKVYGWSRSSFSNSYMIFPSNLEEIQDVIGCAKTYQLKIYLHLKLMKVICV